MRTIADDIRDHGGFLRRRDLLALGHSDGRIRGALRCGLVFRVRHGWYSTPGMPDRAVRAVRVGGRLTGAAALESYGIRVPRRPHVDLAVPSGACRLRRPGDRRARLRADDRIRPHWQDVPLSERLTASRWRVSADDALLHILRTESRDIAVACCSAVMHNLRWEAARLAAVFARAPDRARPWLELVEPRDESHGETFARLWFRDEGIPWTPQPRVRGVGRLDGRIGPNTYIEVDGGQHDPTWTGEGGSSYERDQVRNARMAALGKTTLRFTYRMLYSDWAGCLAAAQRALDDDRALTAYRKAHPYRPRHPALHRRSRRRAARAARAPDENEGERSS
jgi:hypothetical protein